MGNFFSHLKNPRMLVTFLLAFSSGLPLPLVMATLDIRLARENVSLKTIGLFSLVGLPYTVKYLWAPLLDRYLPPFLNRRTGWMLIAQICLVIGIVAMGIISPSIHPMAMAVAALFVAFCSASQDIVIDAYRTDLLPKKEQGPGAGVTVTGARIALIAAGGMAVALADQISWREVYFVMAGLMSIGMITAYFAPTPEIVVKPPKSLKDAVIQPFISYFKLKHAVVILLFILLYKFSDVVAGKMTGPFLVQMGYSNTAIGTYNKTLGMFMTIIGALYGGVASVKMGLWKSLFLFGILQGLTNFAFVAIAQMGPDLMLLASAISAENLAGGMGTAVFTAFLMGLCDKHYTATQYALLTSLFAISRTFLGPLSGYLAANLSWTMYFSISSLFALPGLLILFAFKDLADSVEPAKS